MTVPSARTTTHKRWIFRILLAMGVGLFGVLETGGFAVTAAMLLAILTVGGWIVMAAFMPAPAKIVGMLALVFLPLLAMASVRLHASRQHAAETVRADHLRIMSAGLQDIQLRGTTRPGVTRK